MPANERSEPRDRSRVVCQRCHLRKVKCDLVRRIEQGGRCTNCEKRLEVCERRNHNRAQGQHRTRASRRMLWQDSQEASEPPSLNTNPVSPVSSTSPTLSGGPALATPSATSDGQAYLGELSVLSNHRIGSSRTSPAALGAVTRSVEVRALTATEADRLPPQPRIDALAATYFKYLYHRVPVVNHSDMLSPRPSRLLQQAVCLAGSMLRHPETAQGTVQSEQYYVNAKTLFYNNHEKDPMMVLKALCLLSLWNMTPPAVITIDCSWNWLGLAIRFAFQIGLHKESTYAERSDPGGARRVAWFLYTQDKLQSVCFGRPQMIRTEDFDLRLPEASDFEPGELGRARLFTLHAELSTIFGKMARSHNGHSRQDTAATASEDVLSVLPKLREWASKIPLEFQLVDDRGEIAYQRDAFEVLIWYFTCIVTFFHLHGRLFHPSVSSTLSLVASSCAIRLYQEMDYRDHVNYLMAIGNWSMMIVSLPQLNSLASRPVSKDTDDESSVQLQELDVLMEIISHRTLKFPGAAAMVARLTSLREQALAGVDIAEGDVGGAQSGSSPGAPGTADGAAESFVPVSQVYDFFPFPDALAPKLDLLRTIDDESLGDGELGDFPEWSMEDLFSIQDLDAFV